MNVLILCLGILILLILILGCTVLLRYLNYKKSLTLAEQGLDSPKASKSKTLLRWGIVITILGLVLTFGLYGIGTFTSGSYPLHLGPWMLGGLIPLFLGLGLVLLHYLIEKEE